MKPGSPTVVGLADAPGTGDCGVAGADLRGGGAGLEQGQSHDPEHRHRLPAEGFSPLASSLVSCSQLGVPLSHAS